MGNAWERSGWQLAIYALIAALLGPLSWHLLAFAAALCFAIAMCLGVIAARARARLR